MKNPFSRKISRAFKLSVMAFLICSTISLVTLNRADNKEQWVQHTHLVIQRLEFLLSVLKDAETGARGYIITRQEHTLAPYMKAEATARMYLAQLKSLTKDNPAQQTSLAAFKNNIDNQFQILRLYINETRSGNKVGADQIEQGKQVMDQARRLTQQMENREYRLLELRNQAWRNTWAYIPVLIGVLTILSIISTMYFCRNLLINYFEKVKFRRQLQKQSITMDNRIRIIQAVTAQVSGGNYAVRIIGQEKDILGILADDINSMTASLQSSFRALHEWMQKKDEFINITAHEFRTPLTSIKATLQFVGRFKFNTEDSAKISPFISRAENQVKRLTAILKDLLDVSKINAGNLPLKYSSFTINKVVQESIEEVKANNEKLRVEFINENDVTISADLSKIQQVLTNLISNAVKYSLPGSPVLLHVTTNNKVVRVEITDKGVGIPPEKLSHVFDRYFRVEETSQNYSGMGLGLYIAKGIVEQHGGEIGAESQLGEGSTFWFTIPLATT